jgi:hypothetical protein
MLASVTVLVLLLLVAGTVTLVLLELQRIREERALLRILSDHTLQGVVGVLCGVAAFAFVTTTLNLAAGRGLPGVAQMVKREFDDLIAGPAPVVSTPVGYRDPRPECARIAPRAAAPALNVTIAGNMMEAERSWLRSTFVEALGACADDSLGDRTLVVEVTPLPAPLANVFAAQAVVSIAASDFDSLSSPDYVRGVGRGTEPRSAQASAVAAAAGELAVRWDPK